jgi:cyclopropane fatty-acyl-phospholipid synthase-like methyltransferase
MPTTRRAPHAEVADKYQLYGLSVQDAEHEVEFFDQAYQEQFGKKPRVLREDFCGTFAICCAWAKLRGRESIGVDLDPEPLDWGRAHNLAPLTPAQQSKVTLLQEDVRTVLDRKADVLAAQNFSFWIFKTRRALLEYFKAAHASLAEQGLMVLDMMGGSECYEENHEDIREIDWPGGPAKTFKYIWEQHRFNPVTSDGLFKIHFRFRDGSALEDAFVYDWRFWSIPEVRELLEEAGFRETHVYWEGTLPNGEGDDDWKRVTEATSDPSWISYIVAVR